MANKESATSCVFKRRLLLLTIGSFLIFAFPCGAVTDQADLSVGMKTLPLLTTKIEGSATVGILFNPANTASIEEAKGIKAILDNGFETPGNLKLTGRLIPVNALSTIAGTKIAVLTSGLNASYDAISAAAISNNILTMSTDVSCVRANKCALGIVSKPHVEIYYSKAAADAAKVGFGEAFTMLVKQI